MKDVVIPNKAATKFANPADGMANTCKLIVSTA